MWFAPISVFINFQQSIYVTAVESGYDFFNVSRVEVSPNPVELEEYPTIRVFGYAST